jgi:hypothetical protein
MLTKMRDGTFAAFGIARGAGIASATCDLTIFLMLRILNLHNKN